jgi:CheY-like chemotaxis protein
MASVLIAEDRESLRRLLGLTLADWHTVLEAADGGEALELLRQHRPDVAILDVVMPMLNGFQLCRLLREDPDLSDLRIIILFANASECASRQAGADRFLAKPFLPSVLLRTVDDLLEATRTPPTSPTRLVQA